MFNRFTIGKKSNIQRETSLYLLAFLLLVSPVVLNGQGKQKKTGTGKAVETGTSGKGEYLRDAARALVLTGNFDKAVTSYALLLQKDSSNISLNAEYAYSLALNGIYDASLSRLDRIWSLKGSGTEVNFYAAQVFGLMGYTELAAEFGKAIVASKAPGWIASKAPEYLVRYGYHSSAPDTSGQDDMVSRFRRANKLAAHNFNLQSIALFEEITIQHPGEYLPYLGYSIALEKASLYSRSALTIEKALEIIGNNPESGNTRELLNKRLVTVRGKIGSEGNTAPSKNQAMSGFEIPKFMAYAGGTASDSYVNLNARIGTYKTGAGSTSLDLGVTSLSGNSSFNVGLLSYFRQKIFVGGYGLSGSFGGGASTLYAKVSLGISIMYRNRTSSIDIFLDGQQPLAPKGAATIIGLSVGRSVYFGKR